MLLATTQGSSSAKKACNQVPSRYQAACFLQLLFFSMFFVRFLQFEIMEPLDDKSAQKVLLYSAYRPIEALTDRSLPV